MIFSCLLLRYMLSSLKFVRLCKCESLIMVIYNVKGMSKRLVPVEQVIPRRIPPMKSLWIRPKKQLLLTISLSYKKI